MEKNKKMFHIIIMNTEQSNAHTVSTSCSYLMQFLFGNENFFDRVIKRKASTQNFIKYSLFAANVTGFKIESNVPNISFSALICLFSEQSQSSQHLSDILEIVTWQFSDCISQICQMLTCLGFLCEQAYYCHIVHHFWLFIHAICVLCIFICRDFVGKCLSQNYLILIVEKGINRVTKIELNVCKHSLIIWYLLEIVIFVLIPHKNSNIFASFNS